MSSWWQEHSHGTGGWAGWGSGEQENQQWVKWGRGNQCGDDGRGDWTGGSQTRYQPSGCQPFNDDREDGSALAKRAFTPDCRGDSRAGSLKRRTTEEGPTYDAYTYLGGDSKASLPLPDRCKLVHTMLDGAVGALTLKTMPGAQTPSTSP